MKLTKCLEFQVERHTKYIHRCEGGCLTIEHIDLRDSQIEGWGGQWSGHCWPPMDWLAPAEPPLLRHSYANFLNGNKTRHNEIIWIRCKAGKLYALRWKRLVIRSLIKSFHFPQPRFKVRRIFIMMGIQWRSIYRGAIWKPSGLSILCPANLDVWKNLQNIVETVHLMMDIVHP